MHLVQISDEDVFRLDISVDYVPFLQIDERLHDLSDDQPAFVFIEEFLSSQLLVEISILAVFEYHVDVGLVIEVSVQLHNVGVVKPPLDFEFPLHLREKVELYQHRLEYDLESDG